MDNIFYSCIIVTDIDIQPWFYQNFGLPMSNEKFAGELEKNGFKGSEVSKHVLKFTPEKPSGDKTFVYFFRADGVGLNTPMQTI
jgi:hypothetical protein